MYCMFAQVSLVFCYILSEDLEYFFIQLYTTVCQCSCFPVVWTQGHTHPPMYPVHTFVHLSGNTVTQYQTTRPVILTLNLMLHSLQGHVSGRVTKKEKRCFWADEWGGRQDTADRKIYKSAAYTKNSGYAHSLS